MTTKHELQAAEDAAWAELHELLESLTPEQQQAPGYTEDGWSVKDLMAHIGAWQAEAEQVLQQMRMGTYEKRRLDIDAMNARFVEANRDLPLPVVKSEMYSARTKMITELNALPEITPAAESWFVESGERHYREHADRLREWVEELRRRP